MNKKLDNEYTYRTHRNNCCNNNCIPNLDTKFHPVSPVDELTERCEHVEVLPSQLINQLINRINHEQKRQ